MSPARIPAPFRNIPLARIDAVVRRELGPTRNPDLPIDDRSEPYATYRKVAMWLARELSHASYSVIGRYWGGRHHTTAIHAVKSIETQRQRPEVAALLERLIEACQQPDNAVPARVDPLNSAVLEDLVERIVDRVLARLEARNRRAHLEDFAKAPGVRAAGV